MRALLIFLFLCPVLSLFGYSAKHPEIKSIAWQNGDIVFTSSSGAQADAVKAATNSIWTQTAIIYLKDGKPMVLEAVQPVQTLSLQKYLDRGNDRKHIFMRLKKPHTLDATFLPKSRLWAAKHLGKNYDSRFQWSDTTMYCSELVWKIYSEAADVKLCELKQVRDYNLTHPKVAALIKQRYGSITKLNLTEKIVAPSDIATSKLLKQIKPE